MIIILFSAKLTKSSLYYCDVVQGIRHYVTQQCKQSGGSACKLCSVDLQRSASINI